MPNLIYSLVGSNKEPKVEKYQSNVYIFSYPCASRYECSPYKVELSKGAYKIECYGAGSKVGGGYTSGILYVETQLTIYLYLGGQGTYLSYAGSPSTKHVYNGGGSGNIFSYEGHGATDVRLNYSSNWSNFESLKSRIMVAGGSGGSECGLGGVGGGINGGDGQSGYCINNPEYYNKSGFGGTNKNGGYGSFNGTFGYAALYLGETSLNNNLGGGGYYGGGSSLDGGAGAGGGSSFISGYFGCDAIAENSTQGKIYHTGQSIHYSNISFVNTVMKNGNETFIAPNRKENEPGHKTTGTVVITVILPRVLCTEYNTTYIFLKKLSFNFAFFFVLK